MRASSVVRCFGLSLVASLAIAQTPTFTTVDTSSLNTAFGNAGKGPLEPYAAGFYGVAYGAGLFVAVVGSNAETVFRLATSPDGVTWTARSQAITGGTTNHTSKVHFINNQFLCFLDFGASGPAGTTWAFTSPDGLTWTQNKVADGRANIAEFDSSPTLTVAAGSNGAQFSSPDLVNWTVSPVVPNAAGFDHLDLAYGAGKFFSSINGFGGATYSSTDGTTWTSIPTTAVPGGGTTEVGNGIVLATIGGGVRYRSMDGSTFTRVTPVASPNTWVVPGGPPRFAGGRFVATTLDFGTFKTGYMGSTDGVTWTPLGFFPVATNSPGTSRLFYHVDIAYGNGKYVVVGQDIIQTVSTKTSLPLILTLDAAAAGSAASTTVTATNLAAGATVQWQRNGANVSGATSASLSVSNPQPADAGIYSAVVTTAGVAATQSFAVGVSTTSKVIGTASEIASNVVHPNGNTFDQILLSGAAASFTADATLNQITRLSFIDLNNDIVQVEFSGAGTVSIVLDTSTGPATPLNYNQATTYMKGHAGIVVADANETTNLSVFSVGRANAVNQALFLDTVTYDGVADIAFVAITSTNGKFGGLRTSNASYFATKGVTGVFAPNLQFTGPVFVGDINAFDTATPVLVIGSSTDTRITGGDLLQSNAAAVTVAGLTQLKFTAGATSHGTSQAVQTNKAVLRQGTTDVTTQIVVNPTP